MKKEILLLFCILSSLLASATHLKGGYISVQRISPGSLTCKIIVTVFTDTESSVLFGGTQDFLNFGDGTQILVPETPSELVPGFSNVGTASYTVFHSYSGPSSYTISYQEPNRNAGVVNMDNSVSTTFYIETHLDLGLPNGFYSTPDFLAIPIFKGKLGTDLSLSVGATSEQDYILLYQLGTPFQDRYSPVQNYRLPENLSINPFTGLITWDTKFNNQYIAGEYAVNIRVSLYKEMDGEYYRVCTVSKDIQIILEDVPEGVNFSTNTELDENGRIYIPTNGSKTVKFFFEKINTPSPIELSAYSELSENSSAFSFTSYDSVTAPNIKVGVFTLTSRPDINRENPYLIIVRGKYGNFAKDIPILFFTQDLQPKLTDFVERITETEKEEDVITVYPNPSKDIFTISLPENQNAQLFIHDQAGRLVHSAQAAGTTTLDLRHLTRGFYYCTVRFGTNIRRIKLIKD